MNSWGNLRTGVSFSLGDFSFGQAKEKSLGHRQVDETALSLAQEQMIKPKAEPPTNG